MRSDILILIIVMAIITYFTRVGSLALLSHTDIPKWFEKWLKHVPTAVLTALIIPSLLVPGGMLDISFNNHYLLAGIIAAYIAFKTSNALLTMLIGMSAMLIMRFGVFN